MHKSDGIIKGYVMCVQDMKCAGSMLIFLIHKHAHFPHTCLPPIGAQSWPISIAAIDHSHNSYLFYLTGKIMLTALEHFPLFILGSHLTKTQP
jgi:hypothetical protein